VIPMGVLDVNLQAVEFDWSRKWLYRQRSGSSNGAEAS
jgi:hypothetical protein